MLMLEKTRVHADRREDAHLEKTLVHTDSRQDADAREDTGTRQQETGC